jgi:Methyltransferase domain
MQQINSRLTSNTFSEKSHDYAAARPQYPVELFSWIRQAAGVDSTVWDAATGNGQAAHGLAAHFAQVFATDISSEQIAAAKPAANIRYSVASAEQSGLADSSCDVVTVAQALHWFDYAKFWPEVRRVCPGGFFCAFGYAWMTATPAVDQELVLPFQELVSPFWAPNNRILWDGYQPADIQFPFEEVPAPDFAIGLIWSINSIIDYNADLVRVQTQPSRCGRYARVERLARKGARALRSIATG